MSRARKALTAAALTLALTLGATTVTAAPAAAAGCRMTVVYFIHPATGPVYATYYQAVWRQAQRMGLRTSYNWYCR